MVASNNQRGKPRNYSHQIEQAGHYGPPYDAFQNLNNHPEELRKNTGFIGVKTQNC
jgi:hypothetical protein